MVRITNLRSKCGSSSVFLSVVLASLLTIALVLVYGAKEMSEKAITNGLVSLAGDSVISEYDRRLQEEYGLFLLKGTDEELSHKLYRYLSYSIDDKKKVNQNSVNVTSARYCAVNTAVIREQIIDHMKIKEAQEMLSEINEKDNEEKLSSSSMPERTLRHGPTIAALPSSLVPKRSLSALAESLANKAMEADKAFKAGTESFLINRYVCSHFNSSVKEVNSNHFFKNEVEYLLGGELSDKKNEKRVEMALTAMRFPINMTYLYADAEKQAALASAAQIMTPGAAAVATQAALASTWAYAEADNDVELLKMGYKVPMVKDEATWAIELDTAIEGVFGGTVVPDKEKGYTYGEYLQILLFFQDENIKLARILDLIQINMRSMHDDEFLISDYAAGISVRVKINGKMYSYEKEY